MQPLSRLCSVFEVEINYFPVFTCENLVPGWALYVQIVLRPVMRAAGEGRHWGVEVTFIVGAASSLDMNTDRSCLCYIWQSEGTSTDWSLQMDKDVKKSQAEVGRQSFMCVQSLPVVTFGEGAGTKTWWDTYSSIMAAKMATRCVSLCVSANEIAYGNEVSSLVVHWCAAKQKT